MIALLAIIGHTDLNSQNYYGGYSESWLSRNIGARPLAMGGVYSAIVNEPNGIFYNPAGSSFMSDAPSFATSVSSMGLNRTFASLAWAQEIIPQFGLGFGINNLNSGSFLSRSINGAPVRDVNNNQISALLAASYRLEFISMGASVKYLNNSLSGANISSTGIAFDLGVKMNVADLFSFGVAMNNIGGSMKWNTSSQISENIPYTLRTGVAVEFGLNEETKVARTTITGEEQTVVIPPTQYILLGMDAVMNQFDKTPSWIVGTEVVFHEFFALRGGLSIYGDNEGKPEFLPMNNWGAGISLRPQLDMDFLMQIDYSVSKEFITTDRIAHHLTLIIEL